MRLYIKNFHRILGIKCKLCGEGLPASPDYVDISGKQTPICNECGNILDAMNAMKTGEIPWPETFGTHKSDEPSYPV